MNLCFLNATEELGGGEIWVLNACREAATRRHTVTVVCPHRSPLADACLAAGINCFLYSVSFGVPFEKPLYHHLKSRQIDVLYCTVIGAFFESEVLSRIVSQINSQRSKRRLVLVLKTGLPPLPNAPPEFYGIGQRPVVRRLHVVGEACRTAFINADWMLDAGFVEVWREGIKLDDFRSSSERRGVIRSELGLPKDALVIVTASRLVPTKGQHLLLYAAQALIPAYPNLRLLIAGDGPERASLETLATQLGIVGHTHFLGHVQGMRRVLAAADLFCHPSLMDGVPNAIIEASSMGLPIVASRLDGIAEVLQDRALFFEPGDVQALYEIMFHALSQPRKLRRLAAKAQRFVRQEFDLNRNLEALLYRLEQEQGELDKEAGLRVAETGRPSDGQIRVLFLATYLRTGGEERELLILSRRLNPESFDVMVLSAFATNEPSPLLQPLFDTGIEVDTTAHKMDGRQTVVEYIVNVILERNIEVLIACQDTSIAYEVMQRLPSQQCMLIEHGGILEEVDRIPKNLTYRYVGVSTEIARQASTKFANPSHAMLIPSMVDLKDFEDHDRNAIRNFYGIAGNACVITFMGRLDVKKGVDVLIRAAASLLPKHPELLFLIVGPPDAFQPDYAVELQRYAEPVTETGRFLFLGARDDTATLLSASDIFALPSRDEGLSHVINEAGAAGLAVVAYDCGGAAEQLEDGKAGILVSQGDEAGFLRAIDRLVLDKARRHELGLRLKQGVAKRYAAAVVVPQWEALLREAARRPVGQHSPALAHADEIAPDFPREIQIQTITLCNAKCVMCPYPQVSQEVSMGQMSVELYEDILGQLSVEQGVSRIEPFLMNEPFIDKRMVDFIRLAKQRVSHSMVTVTTNGLPVTRQVADRLVDSGLDAIWFSFNGATKKTFESIMGISYDKVRRNLEYLLSIRPECLRVFVNMIETTEMRDEIEENIRYWISRGVGAGSSPLVNRGGNVENYDELNYMPRDSTPVRVCELPYYKMYVLYNGDVVLCCMDWRRTVVLGNLKRQTIREVWNGDRYQYTRRMLEEGRSGELDLCNTCSYCLH